ncbi:hypothetical protein ACIRBZ_32075 [Streptomyces sp. NPDC094038]
MKAALVRRLGGPLVIEDRPGDEVRPGRVAVRIVCDLGSGR